MIVIFLIVGIVFWFWYNGSMPVHNVATGGLPTSNR